MIADFIGAVRLAREPLVSGRAALEPHRLIDAIETSARTGQAIDIAS